MLAPRVDTRPYLLGLLLALIAIAWIALWAWGQSPYARFLGHEELDKVHLGLNLETAGVIAVFVAGWTLMTFAMMLPTSMPLVTLFRRLVGRRQDAALLVTLLILGYVAVWSLFGFAAHLGDAGLHASVERWHWLDENSHLIAGATILMAGVYQFTPLKYMCLDKCRSPMSFITEHWHGHSERSESLRLGIHHGLFCVGCCWSLMLLMFAVGVGNIGWMLVLGAVMAIEKNMPWGRRISTPLGLALLVTGTAVLFLGGPAG